MREKERENIFEPQLNICITRVNLILRVYSYKFWLICRKMETHVQGAYIKKNSKHHSGSQSQTDDWRSDFHKDPKSKSISFHMLHYATSASSSDVFYLPRFFFFFVNVKYVTDQRLFQREIGNGTCFNFLSKNRPIHFVALSNYPENVHERSFKHLLLITIWM